MSYRRSLTMLAIVVALGLVLVPLTAGSQEGRPDGATPGTPVPEARTSQGESFTGWDGDGPAPRTLVHSGDSTIQGGLCVGFDCSSNEPMGFATIKIEENNLRIAAADSSTVSGFPTTDWQIEFNSSSSGGGSYFMVRDCGSGGAAGSVDSTCGGTPMLTIEGGADNESIHVDSSGNQGGNVGFGTATPVVDLHALSGNTPTLRLEQDNSSGFTPQSWDMAGNESNFFIRDVTNGSALPFRIEPGTASNTLYLDNTEQIGIGTTAPQADLHIRDTGTGPSDHADLRFEAGSQVWQLRSNHTTGEILWNDITNGGNPFRIKPGSNTNLLYIGQTAADTVNVNGNLTISGQCTEVDGACAPDYVFAAGYNLWSLDRLRAFITANGHLPNVPSAADVEANGINVRDYTFALLEKIEELTLYTLAQSDELKAQDRELAAQRDAIDALRAQVDALLAAQN